MQPKRKLSVGRTNEHEEQNALVQRILSSPLFEKSHRLCKFLQYICDRALSGHPEEVHEQLIGYHVFDRAVDYNPNDDNIVRVSARHLRSKLREYFETYGREEQWFVEIPKGGYLPVFRKRVRESLPVSEVAANTNKPRVRFLRMPSAALVTLAFVLLLLIAWDWTGQRMALNAASSTPERNFIADLLTPSRGSAEIVVSDSALVLMETLTGHQFTLAQYADRAYLSFPKKFAEDSEISHFWGILRTRQISNVGDEEAAHRVLGSVAGHLTSFFIRNARNVTARDFMRGDSILLGSSFSNPWTQLFTEHLNFKFVPDKRGAPCKIRNRHPLAGEQKTYSLELDGAGNGVSYARVALVSNLTHTGRVLLIAGLDMESTEAAADFLLNPSFTQEILHVLGTGNPTRIPNFELLLETSSLVGTPNSARIIAYRVYGGKSKKLIHHNSFKIRYIIP